MTRGQKAAETKKRNKESAIRLSAIKTENQKIVATGKCPQCGQSLVRNLALTGWYQCGQFGAVGFRQDSSLPACSWQAFV